MSLATEDSDLSSDPRISTSDKHGARQVVGTARRGDHETAKITVCIIFVSLLWAWGIAACGSPPSQESSVTELQVITVGVPRGTLDPAISIPLVASDAVLGALTPEPTLPSVGAAPSQPASTARQQPMARTPTPEPTLTIMRVSSPLRRGSGAFATAASMPNASCRALFTSPPGSGARASQVLDTKLVDPDGSVAWIWTIHLDSAPGRGIVTVQCGGLTATAPILIQ
jgi:hypothetical protein